MIGAKKMAAITPSTGAVRPVGPSEALRSGRYIQPSISPANTQTTANTVATT